MCLSTGGRREAFFFFVGVVGLGGRVRRGVRYQCSVHVAEVVFDTREEYRTVVIARARMGP